MIFNKRILVASLVSVFLISLSGCPSLVSSPNANPVINLEKDNVKVLEKISLNVSINNRNNSHQYVYNFSADKGKIESTNTNESNALYTAPDSDGKDTIRVSVFDRTDNINLPQSTKEIIINK